MNNPLLDYRPEMEFLPTRTIQAADFTTPDRSLALAAELLEVDSEAALRDFLAKLIDEARVAGRAVLATPQARALKRALGAGLQQAAHLALPLGPGPLAGPVIEALGRAGPDLLKRQGARVFGLELEGLSPEDKEFELVQHFARFADAAASAAMADVARLGDVPPAQLARRAHALAQAAMLPAARRHAPGLLTRCARAAGYWRRHGSRITVFGC